MTMSLITKFLCYLFIISTFSKAEPIFQVATTTEKKVQLLVNKLKLETPNVYEFYLITQLAKRHGFEVGLEGVSAESFMRFLYLGKDVDTRNPSLSQIFVTNEEIHLVVRGNPLHAQLLDDLLTKKIPRRNMQNYSSLWKVRLVASETDLGEQPNVEIQKLGKLNPMLSITEGKHFQISPSNVKFFVENESDPNQKPTFPMIMRLLGKIKTSLSVKSTRAGFTQDEIQELRVIFGDANSDLSAVKQTFADSTDLFKIMQEISMLASQNQHRDKRWTLIALGFEEKMTRLETRILESQFPYSLDFNQVPKSVQENANDALAKMRSNLSPLCLRFYY